MRISSIVSLVLGILAIIFGAMICRSAEEAAVADGYNLHQNIFDENGNIEKEHSFSVEDGYDVTKLEIELEDVDVYVIGGAEKSKILVRNMFGGTYSCNVSNKVITITNKLDISGFVDAAQGIEFNGIRNIFDLNNFKKRRGEVYIYLNYSSEDIKQISLDVKNCNVSVQGIEGSLDLISKSENSTVSIADFITDSSIKCEMIKSQVSFTNVSFFNANVTGDESSFKFDSELVILYRILASTSGMITANGVEYGESFTHNENQSDFPTINIEFIRGNIDLNFMG